MTAGLGPQFPFVAQLSLSARRTLNALAIRRAPARRGVLQRGDEVDGMFLVTRGSLRVFHSTADGREATLYWVRPGQTCLLALTATLQRAAYPAWAEAEAEAVSFAIVPAATVRTLLAEPAFREFALAALSTRVFELMAALEELGTLRVEQRVARYVLRHADADGRLRISQQRLAGHLGTAREVVSRALRALVAQRAVTSGRAQIQIADRARLARLAGDDER